MIKILPVVFLLMAGYTLLAQPELVNEGPELFTIVEEMPMFPGCEEIEDYSERRKCAEGKMLNFIYQNIYYPAEARELGMEGMVVVTFIVNKTGGIDSARVVRDIGGGCGETALEVVKMMPDWNPGKQKGEAVNVQFNLPVRFKLEDPVKQLNEIPEYTGLSIVFCEDFAGEFFNAVDLNSWADSPYNIDNLCGFNSKVTSLELTYEMDGQSKYLTSEGDLTDEMRDIFRMAKPGSTINLQIDIERQGMRGKIIKVLLVE